MSNQKDVEMFGENSIFVKQNKALDIIKEKNENLLERIKNDGPPQKPEEVSICELTRENSFYKFFQSKQERIDCSDKISDFNKEVDSYNIRIEKLERENKEIDKLKTSGTIKEKDLYIIVNQKLDGMIDNYVRSSDVVSVGKAMTNLIERINDSEKAEQAEREMVENAYKNAEIVIKNK